MTRRQVAVPDRFLRGPSEARKWARAVLGIAGLFLLAIVAVGVVAAVLVGAVVLLRGSP